MKFIKKLMNTTETSNNTIKQYYIVGDNRKKLRIKNVKAIVKKMTRGINNPNKNVSVRMLNPLGWRTYHIDENGEIILQDMIEYYQNSVKENKKYINGFYAMDVVITE